LFYPIFSFVPHSDGDSTLGIVSDAAVDNWIQGWHILTFGKPTEQVIEILETLVRLHILVAVGSEGFLLLLNLHHRRVSIDLLLEHCLLLLEISHGGLGESVIVFHFAVNVHGLIVFKLDVVTRAIQ
jgi:hypothetical protein